MKTPHVLAGAAISIVAIFSLLAPAFAAAATNTTLSVTTGTATYGGTVTLTATLTAGGTPEANKTVFFNVDGNFVGSDNTNSSGVATLTGVDVSDVSAGTHTNDITASFFGGGGLNGSNGEANLVIQQKTLTVSNIDASNKVYNGSTAATLTNLSHAQLNGVINFDHVTLVTTGATGAFVSPNVGNNITVDISGLSLTGSGAGNYQLGTPQATATATISPANANVSVTPYSVTYDGNAHTATFTATGVGGADLSTDMSVSGTTHTAAGSYTTDPWTFTDSNGNYNSQNGTVNDEIAKADQTFSFGSLSDQTFGAPDFTVSATSNSSGTNAFTGFGSCWVNGSTVHLLGIGGCTIVASNPGDQNYNPSAAVTQAFQVNAPTDVVYDAIPSTFPGNIASEGFEADSISEFGDYIHLGGSSRLLNTVTVMMSDWALQSDPGNVTFCTNNPSDCSSNGYTWPITVNIYSNQLNANGVPDQLLATETENVEIPWRPAADPTCSTPTAWRNPANDTCYNGLAFDTTFDLSNLDVILPSDVIVSVAFNTEDYGAAPTHAAGPYDSLNVGVNSDQTVSVGSDDSADKVFLNSTWTGAYNNDGGPTGIFREDSGWTPYGTLNLEVTASPVTTSANTVVVQSADLATSGTDAVTNPSKWFFYNEETNAFDNTLGSFVDGPDTAPLGEGSAQISVSSDSQSTSLGTLGFEGTALSKVTSLSYSTYRSAGDSDLALALQFDVNTAGTGAPAHYEGRLVYEPYYTHTVSDNTWQTWNPMDDSTSGSVGNWYFSDAGSKVTTNCTISTPCTWSQILAEFPNIGISGGTYFKAGSGWDTFTGNVDDFAIGIQSGANINTTTFDFEPTPYVNDPSQSLFEESPSYVRSNNAGDTAGVALVPAQATAAQFTFTQTDGTNVYTDVAGVEHTQTGQFPIPATGQHQYRVGVAAAAGTYTITGEYEVGSTWYPITGTATTYVLDNPTTSFVFPNPTADTFRPTDDPARVTVDDTNDSFSDVVFTVSGSSTTYTVDRAQCDLRSAGDYVLCDISDASNWTGLADGTYTATAIVYNQARGNTEITSQSFTVDDTVPSLSNFAITNTMPTYGTEIDVTADASDAASGIANVEFYVTAPRAADGVCDGNGTSLVDSIVTSPTSGDTYTASLDTSALTGPYCVNAVAESNSATHSPAQELSVNIDNTPVTPPVTLDAPTPTFPSDGATLTTAELPDVTWSSVSDSNGGITYTYEVSLSSVTQGDGSFATPADIGSAGTALTDTQIDTSGTPDGTYYWHVMATDSANVSSAWSATQSFTIDNTAPVADTVTLTSPGNGATVNTSDFDFTWDTFSTTTPGAVTYEWESSLSNATNDDGSFSTQLEDQPGLTDTTLDSPGTPDNTYYWHVRATDADGNVSPWSDTWSVTVDTVAPPVAPTAVGDSATTDVNTEVSIDVLANDTGSPTGIDPTSITPTTTNGGTVAIDGTEIDYTPANNFSGTDSFTYEAYNAVGTSSPATVSVSVKDTSTPVLTLMGSNPLYVTVGALYNEPGVTISDPASNNNLDYFISVDGNTPVESTSFNGNTVDTTAPQTHTLTYTATNNGGNTGSTTRTVIVLAPVSVALTSTSATDTTISDNPIPVTATFSGPVQSFTSGDISITNGAASDVVLNASSTSATFNVLPASNGTVTVTIPVGDVQSKAGDTNTAAATIGFTYAAPVIPAVTPTFTSFVGGGSNGPISGSFGGPIVNVTTPPVPGQGTGPQGQVLGASAYNFTTNFGIGSSGEDVIQLQTILIADGYLNLSAPTGYFGQLTKAAVIKFQAANNITPTSGYVGPKTRAVLNKGVTPTSSDEVQSLQEQLQQLLSQIDALSGTTTTQ